MDIKAKITQNEAVNEAIKKALAEMQARTDAMPLDAWLSGIDMALYAYGSNEFLKNSLMREYVIGLHKRGLMYHFDDCAIDCLHDNGVVTMPQAEKIGELTKEFHCEAMFQVALDLLDEEPCINCGSATPHAMCSSDEEE